MLLIVDKDKWLSSFNCFVFPSACAGRPRIFEALGQGALVSPTAAQEAESQGQAFCPNAGHVETPAAKGWHGSRKRSCAFLPGSAAESSKPAHLHCLAADEAERCLAPLSRGGRCKRERVEGNFCRQHYLEWSAKDKNDKILSEWRDLVEDAAVARLVA